MKIVFAFNELRLLKPICFQALLRYYQGLYYFYYPTEKGPSVSTPLDFHVEVGFEGRRYYYWKKGWDHFFPPGLFCSPSEWRFQWEKTSLNDQTENAETVFWVALKATLRNLFKWNPCISAELKKILATFFFCSSL